MKGHIKALYHSARIKVHSILSVQNPNPVHHGPLNARIAEVVKRLSEDPGYAMHKHRLGDQISVLFHAKHISIVINEHQINVWLENP